MYYNKKVSLARGAVENTVSAFDRRIGEEKVEAVVFQEAVTKEIVCKQVYLLLSLAHRLFFVSFTKIEYK